MTTALHLCTAADFDRLFPLVKAFHLEMEIGKSEEHLEKALNELLAGTPLGVAYLIGPKAAPVGYLIVCFGFSLDLGGVDGMIDEFYIRPGVRGRGMGTEVLQNLVPALENAGIKALCLEVDRTDESAQRIYRKAGFKLRDRYSLMTLEF